ncbi:UNKNOWN [Stylonychia lemnae]|uniref:Uncharacterized protein n=1 Tax=Stylonychia lemnae TaxID=5949 RepID=A0A078AIK0_STYLE|nr:UNKNOWN [Stylonychia lemnae]|eukprot:CDW80638.1 UNKNOWN [Stylonychia lemnae]
MIFAAQLTDINAQISPGNNHNAPNSVDNQLQLAMTRILYLEMGEECDGKLNNFDDGCDDFCKIKNGYTATYQDQSLIGIHKSCRKKDNLCMDLNIISDDGCNLNCETEQNYYCLYDFNTEKFKCYERKQLINNDIAKNNSEELSGCIKNNKLTSEEECDDGDATHSGGVPSAQIKILKTLMDEKANLSQNSLDIHQINSICKNGIIEIGEQCDDGDQFSFEKCDQNCHVQFGFHQNFNGKDIRSLSNSCFNNQTNECYDRNENSGDGYIILMISIFQL